jgi:hypothetical protein
MSDKEQSKSPIWKFITPILISVIIGLTGIIYNQTQGQISQLQKAKAEKEQLELLVKHQNGIIEAQARLFSSFEETLSKVSVDIVRLQTQMEMLLLFKPVGIFKEKKSTKDDKKITFKKKTISKNKSLPFDSKQYINKFQFQIKK